MIAQLVIQKIHSVLQSRVIQGVKLSASLPQTVAQEALTWCQSGELGAIQEELLIQEGSQAPGSVPNPEVFSEGIPKNATQEKLGWSCKLDSRN